MSCGIYKIVNKVNGKYYVGSSKNIQQRWNEHRSELNRNIHKNTHLKNSWKKYGKENFDFIIVEQTKSNIKILKNTEQKYLDIAKTEQNKCYNQSFIAYSPEFNKNTLLKLSMLAKKNISKWWKGKKFSDEHKRNIGNANRGKIVSIKSKILMRKSKTGKNHPMYGKHHSPETILKMRHSQIGENSWMYGKKHTKKTILKMRHSAHKGKDNFMSNKGYLISGHNHPLYDKNIYKFQNSLSNEKFCGTRYNFTKKYKLEQSCISRLIKGYYKSHKNWKLIYDENKR